MITKASIEDIDTVQQIVSKTISAIYPDYYTPEVVNFFLQYHNEENISRDLKNGNVYLISENSQYIGTGTIVDNNMNRIFILPQQQRKGYGTQLMDFLEKKIAERYNRVLLDSSLPAFDTYIKRGYEVIEYLEEPVEGGGMLCYQTMSKSVYPKSESAFNLNNRLFVTASNTENGEVSDKTYFKYHQDRQCVWASYCGGNIVRGSLIGRFIAPDKIYFTYQHLNINGDIRIGEGRSTLEQLPGNRLRIHESWQWLNGDMSSGHSVIEEK